MRRIIYMAKWFKDEAEAKKFQREHGGAFYKNAPKSRTRKDHLVTAMSMGFDPDEYPYSVNWNEWLDEAEIKALEG